MRREGSVIDEISSQNALPGVPRVESPFFGQFFPPGRTDPELHRIATSLRTDGYAVFDFPEPDFDALAERLKHKLADRYDWEGWRAGRVGGLRIQDVWGENEESYRLATNTAVLDMIRALYGREAFPFQSLNFPVGTQQHYHSDSLHFSSMPERFMCGVWVALEDIGPDQGPLIYYPGSHRWPIYTGEHVGHTYVADTATNQTRYDGMWEAIVAAEGVQPQRFLAKKGQGLIWAANLLHGGDKQTDMGKTRWSQVTHYLFKNCAYYTPMQSDPALGIVSYRRPFNILTRSHEQNHYNGAVIPDEVVAGASPWHPRNRWAIGLPEGFDGEAYLSLNPDVRAAGADPAQHYLQSGRREGRAYEVRGGSNLRKILNFGRRSLRRSKRLVVRRLRNFCRPCENAVQRDSGAA